MELIDVIDENNNLTGKTEDKDIVHAKGMYHREISVWIMNKNGEILLQKRAMSKKQHPGKWSIVAGHIQAGETPLQGAIRETKEEVGIGVLEDELEAIVCKKEKVDFPEVQQYNNYFDYVYFLPVDYKIEDYTIQIEELSEIRYITIEDFIKELKEESEKYVHGYDKLKDMIQILTSKREELMRIKQ